jgi:periplasmic protein TonB
LAENTHSLRIPLAGDVYSTPGAFAGTLANYALSADSAFAVGAASANYALSIDVAIPTGAPPPLRYALVADREGVPARSKTRRTLYATAAAALALHLMVLAFFLVRGGTSRQLGAEEGLPENLNVSVISAADLKKLSSDPFLQEARPSQDESKETPVPPEEAPTPPAPPQPPTPPQPPVQEANAASSASQSPAKRPETSFDPSSFIAQASEQFSTQLTQAFKAADAKREAAAKRPAQAAPNVRALRPGATHVGKSDEFARAVIWALGATKPMGNGKWGSTVVTFIVSASGKVDGLRLLKSSGDNWLDEGALLGVRQARMPVPPPGLPQGDRSFNVEYISIPNG